MRKNLILNIGSCRFGSILCNSFERSYFYHGILFRWRQSTLLSLLTFIHLNFCCGLLFLWLFLFIFYSGYCFGKRNRSWIWRNESKILLLYLLFIQRCKCIYFQFISDFRSWIMLLYFFLVFLQNEIFISFDIWFINMWRKQLLGKNHIRRLCKSINCHKQNADKSNHYKLKGYLAKWLN